MIHYNMGSQLTAGMKINGKMPTDGGKVRIYKVNANSDFHRYSESFRNAGYQIASLLLDEENEDISQLDTYFFPLTFIYRHAIELKMKGLVFDVLTDKEKRISFLADTFHDLSKIFSELMRCTTSQRPTTETEWLESYFKSVSGIDKASDSFRYPFHIDRKKSWDSTVEYSVSRVFSEQISIDLIQLVQKFEASLEILSKWNEDSSIEASYYKSLTPSFLDKGGYYYNQAVVGYAYRHQDFEPYTDAYCETAGFLRSYMEQLFVIAKYKEAETYFLPMCYLYRNCVELAEKQILFSEDSIPLSERCRLMLENKHSIAGLWNAVEPYAQNCASVKNFPQTFNLLKQYCEDLHEYDPQAIKFRYPIDKEINPLFIENQRFEFLNVSAFFEGIINTLLGIDAELFQNREYLREAEAENRSFLLNQW